MKKNALVKRIIENAIKAGQVKRSEAEIKLCNLILNKDALRTNLCYYGFCKPNKAELYAEILTA